MTRPNFFILGAPKCGTTSLAAWLTEHPNVYFSVPKEPHFFEFGNQDTRTVLSKANYQRYEALFAGAGHEQTAVGEGSTNYLYSRAAIARILDYAPDAKFIVCLRNPIEMAPSLHGERIAGGWEPIKDFSRAWDVDADRQKGRKIPRAAKRNPYRVMYGPQCRLGYHLSRLFEQVPKSRVLPVLLDDIKKNPTRTYSEIQNFLNIPDDGRTEFPKLNPAKRTKSRNLVLLIKKAVALKRALGINGGLGVAHFINSRNITQKPRVGVSEELRQDMTNYFADDIRFLETLIERDLSHWREVVR